MILVIEPFPCVAHTKCYHVLAFYFPCYKKRVYAHLFSAARSLNLNTLSINLQKLEHSVISKMKHFTAIATALCSLITTISAVSTPATLPDDFESIT